MTADGDRAGDRALVLGGGGLAGIAWMFGILAGLAERGVEVTDPDVAIGTSAGSVVAAQLHPEVSARERYEYQISAASGVHELTPVGLDVAQLWAMLTEARAETVDPLQQRRKIGAIALKTQTANEADRRESVASRLAIATWPERDVRITAVDAHTGEPRVFTRESGVELVDAVAASCAVPGVWPPVSIDGRRYVDGGVRTMVNADLAEGFARILILAPMSVPELEEEVAGLRRGSRVEVIAADEAAQAAFGPNPLDPATRIPAAKAGFDQGLRAAHAVRALWAD